MSKSFTIIGLIIICILFISCSALSETKDRSLLIQQQIYTLWFARKRKIIDSINNNEGDLLVVEELDAINKMRIDNNLGDMSHFALLLLREGQQAFKNKQYDRAEKLINYAQILAPNYPHPYYAQGYFYIAKDKKAINQALIHYFKGLKRSLSHPSTLFIKIYKSIIISLFCFIFLFIIITVSISAKHLLPYLTEIKERYRMTIKEILRSMFMIILLFVPFIFRFSIMWFFLYFPIILWPYLRKKEKKLVFFLLIGLIILEPIIMQSVNIVSHINFENYDFPSVLVYEKNATEMNAQKIEKEGELANISELEALFQKKAVFDVWSEIKNMIKTQKVNTLLFRPISKEYSNLIFNPIFYIALIIVMLFLHIQPQIGQCSNCLATGKNMVISSFEKRLLCTNCYLLFSHELEIKLVKKRQIEESIKVQYDILRIISYFLPGFIQFWEKERISGLLSLLIFYIILVSFYLSLQTTLAGQFLIFINWQSKLIIYLPIIIGSYFFIYRRDREIIKDKKKKLDAVLTK